MAKKQREVISAEDVGELGFGAEASEPRFKQNPIARRAMRIYGAFWRQNPDHVTANEAAFREQSEALAVDQAYAGLSPEMIVHTLLRAANKQLTVDSGQLTAEELSAGDGDGDE